MIKQKVSRLSIESIAKNVELQYFEMVLGGSMLQQIRSKFRLSIVDFGETSHNKYYVNFMKKEAINNEEQIVKNAICSS